MLCFLGTNWLVGGEWKVTIKRKIRDFDEDLQDEFWYFNPEYLVNPVEKYL